MKQLMKSLYKTSAIDIKAFTRRPCMSESLAIELPVGEHKKMTGKEWTQEKSAHQRQKET